MPKRTRTLLPERLPSPEAVQRAAGMSVAMAPGTILSIVKNDGDHSLRGVVSRSGCSTPLVPQVSSASRLLVGPVGPGFPVMDEGRPLTCQPSLVVVIVLRAEKGPGAGVLGHSGAFQANGGMQCLRAHRGHDSSVMDDVAVHRPDHSFRGSAGTVHSVPITFWYPAYCSAAVRVIASSGTRTPPTAVVQAARKANSAPSCRMPTTSATVSRRPRSTRPP